MEVRGQSLFSIMMMTWCQMVMMQLISFRFQRKLLLQKSCFFFYSELCQVCLLANMVYSLKYSREGTINPIIIIYCR